MAEVKISDDAIIRQIIWAVRDPGSIVPRNGHKESDDDWTARAVRCVLGGRLLPPGGEVSDSPHGLGNREYARRIAVRLYQSWSKPVSATAAHAQVLIEAELDAIAAEIWGSPVVPDSTEGGSTRDLNRVREVSEQYTVLELDPEQRNGGMVIHWSIEDAEEWKTRFKDDPGGYEGRPYRPGPFGIYRRQMRIWEDGSEHYMPWSPVLSDNSEGESNAGD